MFKKALIVLAALGIPAVAWASCTYNTYYINGKYVSCTTCCYGSSCNTTCY